MRSSLPSTFGSSVLIRHDKARPYLMKALIFGPDDTPYDSGAFVFGTSPRRALSRGRSYLQHGVCFRAACNASPCTVSSLRWQTFSARQITRRCLLESI